MRIAAAISLALLAACASAAPPKLGFFWASSAAATGGLDDDVINEPTCVAYWHPSYGVALSGTNVLSWTDQVGGRVAAATNASTTPWYDPLAFGGKGGLLFNNAQALNFSPGLSSTNSTTIFVGWKPNSLVYLYCFGRYDSDGGPAAVIGNGTIYFHPDANDKGVHGALGGASFSNYVLLATSHTGGNVTTNNALIVQNGTNLLGVVGLAVYDQAGPGPEYNRIGGRRNAFSTGRLGPIVHFQPQLSVERAIELSVSLRTNWFP